MAVGFICAAIAVFSFGSNFIPVKKYETGDGLFYQFILCVGIWIVGFITYLILGLPPMSWRAMIGGVIWCTGNLATVPIIQSIGLAMGLLLWGSTNMLMGWLSGIVGFFGMKNQRGDIKTLWMNILGMVICSISIGISLFVKTETVDDKNGVKKGIKSVGSMGVIASGSDDLISDGVTTYKEEKLPNNSTLIEKSEQSWIENLAPVKRRIIGVVLALCAGCCYGLNFTPAQVDFDTHEGKWNSTLELSFSLFCGILIASTFYFICYCLINKQPKLYPKVIIPALISGAMWGIAEVCWFVANDALSFAISFPIIVPGPSAVSSLWGLFLYIFIYN